MNVVLVGTLFRADGADLRFSIDEAARPNQISIWTEGHSRAHLVEAGQRFDHARGLLAELRRGGRERGPKVAQDLAERRVHLTQLFLHFGRQLCGQTKKKNNRRRDRE